MIKKEDFRISVDARPDGMYVHVLHLPTGDARTCGPITNEPVARVRDRLVRELKHRVYREEDFQVDLCCSPGIHFLRVTHLPTGRTRQADVTGGHKSHVAVSEDLIDQILEEIFRK
jgi:hypothetical protein